MIDRHVVGFAEVWLHFLLTPVKCTVSVVEDDTSALVINNCQPIFLLPGRLGRNAVSNPSKGRNEHTINIYPRLVWSASTPSNAEPTPPIPNAKPKNSPDIVPIFPGISSWAYTRIAEKAEARIKPIIILNNVTTGSET